MGAAELVHRAAVAIRRTKYTHGVHNRRSSTPTHRDVHYAAAALPALLYHLAEVTAAQGRLSSGALIKLAQDIEAQGDGA